MRTVINIRKDVRNDAHYRYKCGNGTTATMSNQTDGCVQNATASYQS